MKIVRLAILLALSTAGVAEAQSRPPAADPLAALGIHVVQPMSPVETASTRAAVELALQRDVAAGAFDNATDANGGSVRHRMSGLTCPLGRPGQSVQVISPSEVVCRSENGDAAYETRVAQASAGATLASVVQTALEQARRESGFSPYGGPSVEGRPNPGSGRPEHRTLRFFTRAGGPRRLVRLQVGVVDGFVLSERKTAPEPRGGGFDMSELLSEASFGSNLKHPAAPRGS